MTRLELTEKIFVLKKRKEEIELEKKQINSELEQLEFELITVMENESLQNFKDDRYGTVFLYTLAYPEIKDENLAFEWFEKNNMEDVIQIKRTVKRDDLRQILQEHGEIPGVSDYSETSVRFRK